MWKIMRPIGLVSLTIGCCMPLLSANAQDSQRRSWRGRDRQSNAQQQQGDQQQGQQQGQDRSRDGRRDRGGRSRDGGFGGRGGDPLSPENQERFLDHMVERQMERLSRTYQLDDSQKVQAQGQLERLKAEQRQFAESRRQQFEQLGQQMRQLRESQGRDSWNSPQARQLGEQMRSMWRDSPLGSQRVSTEVEKILPPEQAQRGRAAWDAENAEREQRFESWRRDREQRMKEWRQQREQQGEAAQDPNQPLGGQQSGDQGLQPGGPPPWQQDQSADDGETPRRSREDRRREWDQRREDYRRRRSEQQQQGWDGSQSLEGQVGVAQPGEHPGSLAQQDPTGPWERYVRDFIRRYRLDSSQRASAESVLREALRDRAAYEQGKREDFTAAQSIADPSLRQQQVAFLNQPVESMYHQLRTKLEQLPTLAQRQAVGEFLPSVITTQPASTSQPAVASTQPAEATSRPSFSRRGDSESGERRDSRRDRSRRPRE